MKKFLLVPFLLMLSQVSLAKTVKLCGVDWPPFTYDERGMLTRGLSIDVHREAFSRLGMTIEAGFYVF